MTAYGRIFSAALLLASTAGAGVVHAQSEIVQPLPPPGTEKLASALSRLAADPHNVPALLDAGDAALLVGDVAAAIGFFGRAKELSPENSRVKLGLAKAYVHSRRPIEALRLFAEAERAGVSNLQMAEDRGLAFDLVGDNASAQQMYRLALGQRSDAALTLRLALSQAIAGDRKAFEATLLPLLEQRNVSAFRTRAFGLAILGDTKAAIDIANTMLSPQMARQMRAYLEYMPRLTQAQQAAAGMLGIFPSSGSIGTDDAEVAGYRSPGVRVANTTSSELPPKGRAAELPPRAANSATAKVKRGGTRPDRAGTVSKIGAASREKASKPATQPAAAATPTAPEEKLPPGFAPTKPAVAAPPQQEELPPGFAPSRPVIVARAEEPAALPRPAASQPPVVIQRSSPPPPPPPPPAYTTSPTVQEVPEPASVADAFNSFSLPSATESRAAEGAVDITRIEIRREKPAPPPPPPPPAEPARHWVQVATGKDRAALAFDWRRISRKADGKLEDKGPFVTPWGVANRLLAGPFDTAEKAREMVKQLKALDLDSFTFDSAEGEKIEALK